MLPEPTDEELKHWWDFAQKVAKNKKFERDYLSLGPDHYASEAIEKLLSQEKRPENVEAWLRTVIINSFKNHDKRNVFEEKDRDGVTFNKRRIDYRDGYDADTENELAYKLLNGRPMSLGTPLVQEERLAILLGSLSPKDRHIVNLKADGFDTDEIAAEMGYASAKVVANRLKIIAKKVEEEFGEEGKNLF